MYLLALYAEIKSTFGFKFPPPKTHFGLTPEKINIKDWGSIWQSNSLGGLTNFWGGSVFYGIEYVIKISKVGDWVLLVNNDVQLSSNVILELIKTYSLSPTEEKQKLM